MNSEVARVDRLNIKYFSEDIDVEFDKGLEKLLAELGFKRWASGHNMVDERDLCFERASDKEDAGKGNGPVSIVGAETVVLVDIDNPNEMLDQLTGVLAAFDGQSVDISVKAQSTKKGGVQQ